MEKTKYKYNYNKKLYRFSIVFLIIVPTALGYMIYESVKKISENNLYVPMIIGTIILFLMASLPLILHILGMFKGKIKRIRLRKKVKSTNPYIYYRELPNLYGIGIASLLLDSTIENEKDIVAIILNLCAKKYLMLKKENEKYVVKVLKNIDSNLLGNEKYIMFLILNNQLTNIDYDEWFNYLIGDGLSLGLFTEPKEYRQGKNMLKSVYYGGYLSSLKTYLEPTETGIKELQKLLSFKNFLKDFGTFAEKNPEEIILWDYYLCYAQVFGLTDSILKSGYDKLIKNSSFEIEDLDSVHLNEISIDSNKIGQEH